MKRRFFLKSVPLAGFSLTLPGFALADKGVREKNENETPCDYCGAGLHLYYFFMMVLLVYIVSSLCHCGLKLILA